MAKNKRSQKREPRKAELTASAARRMESAAERARRDSLDARLWSALWARDWPRAQSAYESGADVNAQSDNEGEAGALLRWAALCGHADLCAWLIERGAGVDLSDAREHTPLHCAANRAHEQCVKVLLHAGASVSARDESASLPMHEAARSGSEAVVRQLAAAGSELSEINRENGSPLHEAALAGRARACALLCELGASLEAINKRAETAIETALNFSLFGGVKDERKECAAVLRALLEARQLGLAIPCGVPREPRASAL